MNAPVQNAAPSLTLKRQLNAPVAKVFRAWTDPAMLRQWFGPSDEMAVIVADVDFRVGGRYHLGLRQPDGVEHHVGGAYREIVENRRLVFTWAWHSTPERESLVTVEVSEKDGGTLLTLHHAQFADEEARERHNHGWMGSLDRLVRLIG